MWIDQPFHSNIREIQWDIQPTINANIAGSRAAKLLFLLHFPPKGRMKMRPLLWGKLFGNRWLENPQTKWRF